VVVVVSLEEEDVVDVVDVVVVVVDARGGNAANVKAGQVQFQDSRWIWWWWWWW
jgi:hypothetical protein